MPIINDVREVVADGSLGTIDVVHGGFPCPRPLVAGKQRGLSGERSGLWYEMLELFPNSDPLTSLLRTCVERAISPCLPSSPVWKEKATKCGQASFQLLHLERRTSGKDSSSSESGAMWPTPSQRDYKGANGDAHFLSKERPHLSQLPNAVKVASGLRPRSMESTTGVAGAKSGDGLATAVRMWRTPDASCGERNA